MAGPQIDRGSDEDHLTGIAMPFDGASVLRGRDRRWYVDQRPGFSSLPPSPAAAKRFLRGLRDQMSPDLRAGLRLAVMRSRRLPEHRIRAALEPACSFDDLEARARDATEIITAAFYREFGCVPSHWTTWIGRV